MLNGGVYASSADGTLTAGGGLISDGDEHSGATLLADIMGNAGSQLFPHLGIRLPICRVVQVYLGQYAYLVALIRMGMWRFRADIVGDLFRLRTTKFDSSDADLHVLIDARRSGCLARPRPQARSFDPRATMTPPAHHGAVHFFLSRAARGR